jgi:2'-hydroxyisoflavone reductase
MRLLVIGGTEFVGRAFVEEAVRSGHQVTIFHRGRTEPPDLPDVTHLHGDREGALGALGSATWDAVLDTCGYVPRVVGASARVLAERAARYLFVSTTSVYPDETPPGGTEDASVHQPPYPDTEDVTGQTYGPLKVACELAVREVFGDRATIVRPGYIVGPHDPTERFVSWLRRAARGGAMYAPGPPDEPLQVIDVRDLGAFMLRLAADGRSGTYNGVGPGVPLTMRAFLETAVAEGGAGTRLVWVDRNVALGVGDEDERYRLFPMWHPEYPGTHRWTVHRAMAAGLRHRPFVETVRDTIAWDRSRPAAPIPYGPSPDEEQQLLERARAADGAS